MTHSSIIVLSLLSVGSSLKLDPRASKAWALMEAKDEQSSDPWSSKGWAKREFKEEQVGDAEHARSLAAAEQDKTGGNAICKAKMGLYGKKIDFKAIKKARENWAQADQNCQNNPSKNSQSAKTEEHPGPSTDEVQLGGIMYITLGGDRAKYMSKTLRKVAKNSTHIRHEAGGPPTPKNELLKVSTGKDHGSLSQYNQATIAATRAVYLSHMEAILRVPDLAKETTPELISEATETATAASTEDPTANQVWMILEDDTAVHKDFKTKIVEAIRKTPSDWDMIKVGYWAERRCSDKLNDAVFVPSTPSHSNGQLFWMGNQGYLVRPASVPRILEAMKRQNVADVDDSFLSAACRSRSKKATAAGRPCLNLYATGSKHMAVNHHDMGSVRYSGDAGGWGWGFAKNREPDMSAPWKDSITADNYPFAN